MKKINNISAGNIALNFVEKRILENSYRGMHFSQHNRFNFDDTQTILEIIDKIAPNKGLIKIRTTDLSKRPSNYDDETDYAKMCDEIKLKIKKGTQDALRKNIFVDFHRMGLIERYDKNKNKLLPFKKGNTLYVSLGDIGYNLIKEKKILQKYFIFTKSVRKILGGVIDIILNIIGDKNANIKNISIYEYMFFISAIDYSNKFPFSISLNEAKEYIINFKLLTFSQRKAFIEKLKFALKPKKFEGNKNNKRDFHNWKNDAQQCLNLLGCTPYFEYDGKEILYLKTSEYSINNYIKPKRSLIEKIKYFNKHNLKKEPGFELHHIVPLSWAENVEHFKILDIWKNLIYIDGYSHGLITTNNNRNIILEFNNIDIKLKDGVSSIVELKNKKNVLYDYQLKEVLLNYNKQIVEGF